MLKYLENKLFEKTKDTQSAILYAQWEYDKKVIPNALNAISVLFPHYSLHDETHSIAIINNVVRVLGKEGIDKLSAIDIWFILEASYNHDIGMVVHADELIKILDNDDFIDFFKSLLQDKKNGLYEFADQFEITANKKICYKSKEVKLELHDGIKFIIAEFIRQKHADRSKKIIENPDKLPTPRGVIPQRIFKILGDICCVHTKNFNDVMRLPFCEVGIDVEDAHPRFVACLLRIGDLLDLDNNRFSEIMLRTLTKIPIETLHHKNKHLSIESFRIDKKINIYAKCGDYETASVTQHWFDYINSELRDQMTQWNEIVPSENIGCLPTIGDLTVELVNYELIDGKKKPKFSIDTDKALELLQGAGLYYGAYQCIREILQNAVDATLLRIWLEREVELKSETPQSKSFKRIAEEYPIKIEIKEQETTEDYKIWEFSIMDKGIGISTEELNFLMNTGSSSKNQKKMNLIETMPYWLRPSGIFGIGFQSIFMLTEQVKIETKSFFTEQFQIVEFHSPHSAKDGGVLIQKKQTCHKTKPGSKVSFNHKIKTLPERFTLKAGDNNAIRIARNYDPFTNNSLDVELGKVFDEIFNFYNKSCIPVKLTYNHEIIKPSYRDTNNFKYYDTENAMELNIYCDKKEDKYRVLTFYKNQKVEKNSLNFKFLGLALNIHKDKATKALTLNRNEIRPEYHSELSTNILLSAFNIITNHFDEIFITEEQKSIGSMFLNYYYDDCDILKKFDIRKFDQWKNLKINVGNEEKTMENLINEVETVKIIDGNFLKDEFELNQKELIIKICNRSCNNDYSVFFLAKLIMTNLFSFYMDEKEIVFKREQQKNPVTDDFLRTILKGYNDFFKTARNIIPCNIEKYMKLRLTDKISVYYINRQNFLYDIHLPYPQMLSPYISEEIEINNSYLKLQLNEKLYNWVYENRFGHSTTIEEIKNAYEDFINEYNIEELNKK